MPYLFPVRHVVLCCICLLLEMCRALFVLVGGVFSCLFLFLFCLFVVVVAVSGVF